MNQQLLLGVKCLNKLKAVSENPSHAILLLTPLGFDDLEIARFLAANILKQKVEILSSQSYYKEVSPLKDKTSIGIEQLHELHAFCSLKTTGLQQIRRIAILRLVNRSQIEAQNSLLKLLEEPPKDTVFIITCESYETLLSTIRSRCLAIVIQPPSMDQVINKYKILYDQIQIEKAYYMSGGAPKIINEILYENKSGEWSEASEVAKQIISNKLFNRLIIIDQIYKNSEFLQKILYILKQICSTKLKTSGSNKEIVMWSKKLEFIINANEQLAKHAQSKLVLLNLFMNL